MIGESRGSGMDGVEEILDLARVASALGDSPAFSSVSTTLGPPVSYGLGVVFSVRRRRRAAQLFMKKYARLDDERKEKVLVGLAGVGGRGGIVETYGAQMMASIAALKGGVEFSLGFREDVRKVLRKYSRVPASMPSSPPPPSSSSHIHSLAQLDASLRTLFATQISV